MTQVTRTVNELILAAFYLIGEYSEEEPVPGVDFERGFDLLNLIIDHYSGEASYIAYTNQIEFDLQAGQREYSFSNVPGVVPDVSSNRIAAIEYCSILEDEVSYPVKEISRTQIFNKYYNDTITARPSYVVLKKAVEESVLSFFPRPDRLYKCELQAKFYLNKFEKFQPIRNVPLSLQRFFIYALGRELRSYYPSGNWSPTAESEYNLLREDLLNTNDIDMSVRTSGLLMRPRNGFYTRWSVLGG